MASLIKDSFHFITWLSIGYLFGGGVLITDKSLAAIRLNCKVLGIGVAVNVKTSISSLIDRSFSFTLTPNFCSSSTISKPSFLKSTSLLTILCVPIITSTLPFFKSFKISIFSFLDLNLFI